MILVRDGTRSQFANHGQRAHDSSNRMMATKRLLGRAVERLNQNLIDKKNLKIERHTLSADLTRAADE